MNETSRHARAADPATSHAAVVAGPIRGSQTEALLLALAADSFPLCAEEAAMAADLYEPGICWWRRMRELVDSGLAEPVHDDNGPVTVISSAGRMVRVYAPTAAGWARAKHLSG